MNSSTPHSPTLWKNFLPQNQPLGPQMLGISALSDLVYIWYCLYHIESVITSIALKKRSLLFQSVSQFSCSVMSYSLWPHGLQHARPPRPSPTPRVYSNSCPLSWWCHPTISSCHLLLLPPSIIPSIVVFSNESVLCIRWQKYWSFSFNISLLYSYCVSMQYVRYHKTLFSSPPSFFNGVMILVI